MCDSVNREYMHDIGISICICIFRTTGLYTKTLAKIVKQDVTRFIVVFAVVFVSFCGSLFLSIRFSKQGQQSRYIKPL